MLAKPAIFIDRDGTLIEEAFYLKCPEDVVLTKDAGRAIARLNKLGIPVILVTNQAGIGKGLLKLEDYEVVMNHLVALLSDLAYLDAVYMCPCHPEGAGEYQHENHPDRKPNPGMLLQAAQDHNIDLSRSWMIGDKHTDLIAGQKAGCKVALVRSGYGGKVDPSFADLVEDTMAKAIDTILAEHFGGL